MIKVSAFFLVLLFAASFAFADSASPELLGYAQRLPQVRTSAAGGDPHAQNIMGGLNEYGVGMPRNYDSAAKWYKLAADGGLSSAQYNLGRLYSTGQGVPQSDGEAARLWNIAAGNGYAEAQLMMARINLGGQGVHSDPLDARFWAILASKNADARIQNGALQVLHALEGHMNFADMTRINERADAWSPGMQQPLNLKSSSGPGTAAAPPADACLMYKSFSQDAYRQCVAGQAGRH